MSPHKFRKELMALHEQFDNNEQHDAQEVSTVVCIYICCGAA